MQDKLAKKVGQYTISHQVLGKGSFSTVRIAYDQQKHPLAAKIIPLYQIHQPPIKLQHEINCLRRCSHKNVVKLVDVVKTKNNLYLFLQYCPEGDLQQLLHKTGKLSEEQAIGYFSQMITGLQVLSAAGVVHRDLKPANILIKGKTLKLADFGVARKYQSGAMLSSYKGTPLNMAPEILNGDPYTDQVDVYSAGTILYEMLYGQTPYKAKNQEQLAIKIKKGLKLKQDNQISKPVLKLLAQMLQAKPDKRITLNGVIDFLQRYGEGSRQHRLDYYRSLARSVVGGVGVMGAILGAFKCLQEPLSPSTLDLKLYGRLCSRLSTVKA